MRLTIRSTLITALIRGQLCQVWEASTLEGAKALVYVAGFSTSHKALAGQIEFVMASLESARVVQESARFKAADADDLVARGHAQLSQDGADQVGQAATAAGFDFAAWLDARKAEYKPDPQSKRGDCPPANDERRDRGPDPDPAV
jgi:hypothetical protein